jgi:hypothetical protein
MNRFQSTISTLAALTSIAVTVATVYHAVDSQKQQTTVQQQKLEELQKQLTSKQKESLEQPVSVTLPSPTIETSSALEAPPPPTDTPPTELPGRP